MSIVIILEIFKRKGKKEKDKNGKKDKDKKEKKDKDKKEKKDKDKKEKKEKDKDKKNDKDKNEKELKGEKIAKKNLEELKIKFKDYYDKIKNDIKGDLGKKELYKQIIDNSNLGYFIDYFSDEKIDFKQKKNYLSNIQKYMNKESDGDLQYFINFEEKRFKRVKNMYINNLVEIIINLLSKKYDELKKKTFTFMI